MKHSIVLSIAVFKQKTFKISTILSPVLISNTLPIYQVGQPGHAILFLLTFDNYYSAKTLTHPLPFSSRTLFRKCRRWIDCRSSGDGWPARALAAAARDRVKIRSHGEKYAHSFQVIFALLKEYKAWRPNARTWPVKTWPNVRQMMCKKYSMKATIPVIRNVSVYPNLLLLLLVLLTLLLLQRNIVKI